MCGAAIVHCVLGCVVPVPAGVQCVYCSAFAGVHGVFACVPGVHVWVLLCIVCRPVRCVCLGVPRVAVPLGL